LLGLRFNFCQEVAERFLRKKFFREPAAAAVAAGGFLSLDPYKEPGASGRWHLARRLHRLAKGSIIDVQ
jgi:hypothetical protein